ncbi:ABC transporter permease [Spirillospora sp. CA-108201]
MNSAVNLGRARPAFDAWRFVGRYGALLVLLLMIAVLTALQPGTFATADNAINVLNQSALTAVIAIGLTFPLAAGEFDLSIGYTASLAGVVACSLMADSGAPIPAAFAVAVAVGALVGLVNGLVVTVLRVNALVATLGVGTVVIGANYAISGGVPITVQRQADSFIDLTLGTFLGIPHPVYVMAAVAGGMWVLLNRTVPGQSMQAVGGNSVAARLSGIRVERVRVTVYAISGVCAAVTGVLLASRTGSAAVNGGDGYLLSAFSAVFFGSAVMRDGQFHIVGTLVGVVTVAVGYNAIALIGLATYWQYLFQGTLLILGVGVGSLARRRAG